MSWLYQPLPLASTLTVSDVDEALDASALEVATEHGTLTYSEDADRTEALTGEVSATGIGSLAIVNDEEGLQGQEVAVEQNSLTRSMSVRLRSRKTSGGGSTADRLLDGIQSIVSAGQPVKTVSVLLGGAGVATSQQSFPSKTVARLLVGQERAAGAGTISYVQQGGGGLPSWIQLPTQNDEAAFYDTDFGVGSGKEGAWIYTTTDRTPNTTDGFTAVAPVSIGTTGHNFPSSTMHGDSEADDLWNHYMQYKRSGETRYLSWATEWKNYFISDTETGYLDDLQDTEEANNNFDHIYGQGLVMWGMEQNDLAARNRAEAILAAVETATLALVPGVNSMSRRESRAYARRLIVACYVSMMNPIARWLTLRNHLIDLWVESPGWEDSTNGIIVVGGNHFCGRPTSDSDNFAGHNQTTYDLGFRWNAAHHYGLHNEALWLAYKLTGRTDVADMLVQMGRYTLYYAWDPRHVNSMHGTRWGHRPDGTHLAFWSDEYSSLTPGVPNPGGQVANWTDASTAPTDNNEISDVNGLVYAYKLTGETAFLKRAREHLRVATGFNGFAAGAAKLAQNEVHFFLDTRKDNTTRYFAGNKGLLQYSSRIFENGGLPEVEVTATWTPPYQLPTSPGEVVKIASSFAQGSLDPAPSSGTITHTGGDTTPTTFPTNVWSDVAPPETSSPNGMLFQGDTRTKFIESFSQGGAIVIAGSGGHGGASNFGACLFDFEDARWKWVWTTQGDPGVDNVSNGLVDKRAGRTVHGCLNHGGQLTEWYHGSSSHNNGQPCWNPAHWVSGGGGSLTAQRTNCPLTADPRDQVWEISRSSDSAQIVYLADAPTNTHAYPYTPAEWGGDGLSNRFERTGYVAPSARFTPIPAGTLEPTQSELPAPGHIWDHFYELTPDEGGGPKGSIITGWMQNAGGVGVTALTWSHRYDLHTGIWHKFSTNSTGGSAAPTPPPGGGPYYQDSGIGGAEDKEMRRAFLIAKRASSGIGRVNYMNMSDGTWRNFAVSNVSGDVWSTSNGGVIPQGLTETMVVDPDRRLLIMSGGAHPHFTAVDLQTLGDTNTPEPTPSHARGGWRAIPYDDIPGVQSVSPYSFAPAPYTHGGDFSTRMPWRYYPPNGKFYRVNTRTRLNDGNSLRPNVTVLQRLTPPPIIATPRPDFYYTTEALSGRWTLDEIEIGTNIGGLPAPDPTVSYAVCGFSWFHYVPSIQCLAYVPCDSTAVATRRCVYLIKPY